MILFYKAVFCLCLLLLSRVYIALIAAHKRGDKPQTHMLQFFRLGLALSALSYLLHIMNGSRPGHDSFFILATGLGGTAFIWMGWLVHTRMQMDRLKQHTAARAEPREEQFYEMSLGPSRANGLTRVDCCARQVLLYAQDEARRQNQSSVDTEHLLAALLREPQSAGGCILISLGVNQEEIASELGLTPGSSRTLRSFATQPALTERACQVIELAAQEAHRFDKSAIGSEHLLLGLLLAGKGTAAFALFRQGVTVDGVRAEIINQRPR